MEIQSWGQTVTSPGPLTLDLFGPALIQSFCRTPQPMYRCNPAIKRSRTRMESDGGPEFHLPPNCVANIAEKLVQTQRNWVFPLMAMSAVSPEWREIVSLLPLSTELQLDGLEPAQPLAQKGVTYRQSSRPAQRAFLLGVAGMLHGYGSLICKGPCVHDAILLQVRDRDEPKAVTPAVYAGRTFQRHDISDAMYTQGVGVSKLHVFPTGAFRGRSGPDWWLLPCAQPTLPSFRSSASAGNRPSRQLSWVAWIVQERLMFLFWCRGLHGRAGDRVCPALTHPISDQSLVLQRAASGSSLARLQTALTIDPRVVQAARRSGASWRSLRIEGSPDVTDRALLACGAKAANLQELALAALPGISVRGLTAFMSCNQLATLELADLPAFEDAEVRRQGQVSAAVECS